MDMHCAVVKRGLERQRWLAGRDTEPGPEPGERWRRPEIVDIVKTSWSKGGSLPSRNMIIVFRFKGRGQVDLFCETPEKN